MPFPDSNNLVPALQEQVAWSYHTREQLALGNKPAGNSSCETDTLLAQTCRTLRYHAIRAL